MTQDKIPPVAGIITPPEPIRGAASHMAEAVGTGGAHAAPRTRPRARRIAALVLIGLAALTYIAGVIVFSFLFYPNTTVAGADVSLSTVDTAAARIDAVTGGYTLTVSGAGFSWVYRPSSVRASERAPLIDGDAAARRVLGRNEAYLWPMRLFKAVAGRRSDSLMGGSVDLSEKPDLTLLSSSFDERAFERDLKAAVDAFNAKRTGAFNTESAYDGSTGAFSVERARANEKLNRDNVLKLAKIELSHLGQAAALDTLGARMFLPLAGGVTDDQLKQACDAANGLIAAKVTFKLDGADVGKLDAATLAPWISFDTALSPSLDTTKIDAWAHDLADSLNTVGSQRSYTRPDGKQITVSGGTYGWKVDEKALVETVQKAVKNKQRGDIDVPTTSKGTAYKTGGAPDWGAYADVDLTEQTARYFDASGKLLWQTGIVSGKPTDEDSTPTGVYKVNKKLRNITLVSPKKDPQTGEPAYKSPVQYWIAFIGGAIGFHDASWQRASVYSDPGAYRWAGSHGCINTPLDKVAELYDLIQVGDAVIVHN